MSIDDNNKLVDRAKTRKNGVYKYGWYYYAVKNGKMVAFVDFYGDMYACDPSFNSHIRKVDRSNRKQELLQWLMGS